jgi:uncharacterized protein YrrD
MMMNTTSYLDAAAIVAIDGEIGRVTSAYFDDQTWTIRYLVVDAGSWLLDRKVLISPYAVRQPLGREKSLAVSLTQQQVKDSPDIDTHKPVSRQHENNYLSYYAYPAYWEGGALWGLAALPNLQPIDPALVPSTAAVAAPATAASQADVHLRSSGEIVGYDIQAADDSIGHVKDLVFDDESWAIRYFVVDTRNWWPGGRKVLIGTTWIQQIDWATMRVRVTLTRDQVMNSPPYDELEPLTRDYENRLHEAYQYQGYWI